MFYEKLKYKLNEMVLQKVEKEWENYENFGEPISINSTNLLKF